MNEKYTNNIENFYEQFKQLPDPIELEMVRQLINNPQAKAKPKGKVISKHFKLFIMTTTLVTLFTGALLWLGQNNNSHSVGNTAQSKHPISQTSEIHQANEKPLVISSKPNNVSENLILNPIIYVKENQLNTLQSKSGINSIQIDWPTDTVIDKRKLYVYLTDDEFKKLGVFKVGRAMLYENLTPDGKYCGSFAFPGEKGDSEKVEAELKKVNGQTHFSFFLAYESEINCNHVTRISSGIGRYEAFYNSMDTLVPIVIPYANEDSVLEWIEPNEIPEITVRTQIKVKVIRSAADSMIFWVTPHESLFGQLPDRYKYLSNVYRQLRKNKLARQSTSLVNYIDYNSAKKLDAVPYLTLTDEQLVHIGFQISRDTISLSEPSNTMSVKFLNGGSITEQGFNAHFPPNPFPIIITDKFGHRQIFNKMKFENESLSDDYLSKNANTLVPVLVPLSKRWEQEEDLIFWFYPTAEFINSLPGKESRELKSEINYINKVESGAESSCLHFESCRSTLNINDLKVFPNPASDAVIIEFNLDSPINGRISLIDVSGRELKILLPQRVFNAGFHSFNISLKGVNSGIYLMSILSDKGFKTQRILINSN